jgi:hypothetical protein
VKEITYQSVGIRIELEKVVGKTRAPKNARAIDNGAVWGVARYRERSSQQRAVGAAEFLVILRVVAP